MISLLLEEPEAPFYFLAAHYSDGSEQVVSISLPEDWMLDFLDWLVAQGKVDLSQPICLIEDF